MGAHGERGKSDAVMCREMMATRTKVAQAGFGAVLKMGVGLPWSACRSGPQTTPKLLHSKGVVVSVWGKVVVKTAGEYWEDERKRTVESGIEITKTLSETRASFPRVMSLKGDLHTDQVAAGVEAA
jgi:hypothetical protein